MNILNKIRNGTGKPKLTCQEVNSFLVEYMEGAIDEETRVAFEAHVEKCKNCQNFFEQYNATIEMIRAQEHLDIPPELFEQTMAFLEKHW